MLPVAWQSPADAVVAAVAYAAELGLGPGPLPVVPVPVLELAPGLGRAQALGLGPVGCVLLAVVVAGHAAAAEVAVAYDLEG